jgi:hypothetical protein
MSYHIMDFCISMLYFTSESEYHSVHRWSNHWILSGRGKKTDLRSGWVRSNPINLASQSISNVHDVHQMSINCPSISRTVHTSTHQLPLKTSPRAILSGVGLEKTLRSRWNLPRSRCALRRRKWRSARRPTMLHRNSGGYGSWVDLYYIYSLSIGWMWIIYGLIWFIWWR